MKKEEQHLFFLFSFVTIILITSCLLMTIQKYFPEQCVMVNAGLKTVKGMLKVIQKPKNGNKKL